MYARHQVAQHYRRKEKCRSKLFARNMASNRTRLATMNLLDIIAATEAKEQAIAQVATNTNPQWFANCYRIIVATATNTNNFTTDDIWQALHDAQLPTPHEPRAIGAVLRHAAANNIIRPTNEYRPSKRVACHSRPIRVWVKQ